MRSLRIASSSFTKILRTSALLTVTALILSGCATNSDEQRPGIQSLGWTDVAIKKSEDLSNIMTALSKDIRTGGYTVTIRTEAGDDVNLQRSSGVFKVTLTGQSALSATKPVGSPASPVEIYQIDLQQNETTNRTVVCADQDPSSTQTMDCTDITPILLPLTATSFTAALPESIYGIYFGDLIPFLYLGIHDAGLWETLAVTMKLPSIQSSGTEPEDRTDTDDRVVVTGSKRVPAGNARCFGWFSSDSDLDTPDSVVTTYCVLNSIWVGASREKSTVSSVISKDPGPLTPSSTVKLLPAANQLTNAAVEYLVSQGVDTVQFLSALTDPPVFP